MSIVLHIFILSISATWVSADIDVRASVDVKPSICTLGEPLRYIIRINAPADGEIIIGAPPLKLGKFHVRDYNVHLRRTKLRQYVTIKFIIAVYELGQLSVPPPRIQYRDITGRTHRVDIPTASVSVRGVVPPGRAQLRDVKPPLMLPLPWWVYAGIMSGIIGLILVCILIAGFARELWRRKRTPMSISISRTLPHEEAFASLDALKRDNWRDIDHEAFFANLSHTIRHYLARRFGIPALETTTSATVRYTMCVVPDGNSSTLVRDLLRVCDLVKFARYQPDEDTCKRAWEEAWSVVKQTAPHDMTRMRESSVELDANVSWMPSADDSAMERLRSIAKRETQALLDDKLSLRVMRNDAVLFESEHGGIKPLLDCVQSLGEQLHGATVVDKVIGTAAAKLCIVAGVKRVFAITASEPALAILRHAGIAYFAQMVVPRILNRAGTDLCPFEKLSAQYEEPVKFYEALIAHFSE